MCTRRYDSSTDPIRLLVRTVADAAGLEAEPSVEDGGGVHADNEQRRMGVGDGDKIAGELVLLSRTLGGTDAGAES